MFTLFSASLYWNRAYRLHKWDNLHEWTACFWIWGNQKSTGNAVKICLNTLALLWHIPIPWLLLHPSTESISLWLLHCGVQSCPWRQRNFHWNIFFDFNWNTSNLTYECMFSAQLSRTFLSSVSTRFDLLPAIVPLWHRMFHSDLSVNWNCSNLAQLLCEVVGKPQRNVNSVRFRHINLTISSVLLTFTNLKNLTNLFNKTSSHVERIARRFEDAERALQFLLNVLYSIQFDYQNHIRKIEIGSMNCNGLTTDN